jgi:hypothetical protein
MKTINVFGLKLRPEILLLLVIVGVVAWTHMFAGCSRVGLVEGMQMLGANVNYKMGEGVQGSWDTREQAKGSSLEWRAQDHDAYSSKFVDPEDSLNYFADTEFKPECCGSTYSANGGLMTEQGHSSGGCACLSKQQINYINERGGNRTLPSDF